MTVAWGEDLNTIFPSHSREQLCSREIRGPRFAIERATSFTSLRVGSCSRRTTKRSTRRPAFGMESRSLSVKELRERLDEAGVDYSDCFEKEDLIRRMEQTSTETGARVNRSTSKGKRSDGSAEDPLVRNASTNGETAKDKEPEEKRRDAGEKLKADTTLIQKIKETKDYYEILGLDRKASEIDIKKAYRRLALRLHPDKCGVEGAEEAFKKVSRAFDTLSSPEKKSTYDQFGVDNIGQAGTSHGPSADDIFNAFFGGQQFGGAGMGGPRMYRSSFGSSHVHQADLDDLLSQLFGGGFYSRPSRRAYARTRNPEGMGGSGMGGSQQRSNHPGADRRHQREDTNVPGLLNMVFPLLVLFTVLFPGGHFLGMVLNNLPMIFLLYFLPPQVRKQAFLLMILYFFFF